MSEIIDHRDGYECLWTPAERVWQTVGDIEEYVHGSDLYHHTPYEELIFERTDAAGKTQRSTLMYFVQGMGGSQLECWPSFERIDEEGRVAYQLWGDDMIFYWSPESEEIIIGNEQTMQQMCIELELFLNAIKQDREGQQDRQWGHLRIQIREK